MVHYKKKKKKYNGDRQTWSTSFIKCFLQGPSPPPPRETPSLAFLRLGSAEDSSLFSASQNRAGHRHPNSFGFLGSRRRRKPPKTTRVNALWHVGPGSILPTPPLFLFVLLCFLSVLPRRPAPFRDCRSYFQFLLNCFQFFFYFMESISRFSPCFGLNSMVEKPSNERDGNATTKKITLFSGL